MKQIKSLTLASLLLFGFFLLLTACAEKSTIVDPANSSDYEQLEKLVAEDEVLQSFEPNYNEEEAMDIATSGLAKTIFPVKVGQKMHLIAFDKNFDIQGDTAYGEITKIFDGTLFIAASFDEFALGDSNIVDTLITKTFTTTVKRFVVFVKGNPLFPERDWRILSTSLPNGGTDTENISIKKVTVVLPDGSEIIVEDPDTYFLTRESGLRDQLPIINRGGNVLVRVEISSVYEDDDFVTLTHGAMKNDRIHREKRRFALISSELDGGVYTKVYENVWRVNRFPGIKYAIINVIPHQVIFDDSTPVETNSWGIPYIVK